jgi:hypothetical protein
MTTILAHIFCLLFIWPALIQRFDAPRPRGLTRSYHKQWAAVGELGGRYVAVRLQVAIVAGGAR